MVGVKVDISRYEAIGVHFSEIERDTYYRNAALHFIRSHKVQTASRYLQKLTNHFNVRNELWTQQEASRLNDLVMLLTYGPLLAAAFVRIALLKAYPLKKIELLFLLIYLVNGLFSALFFTRIRFRVPFDLLLIGFVATSVVLLVKSTQLRSNSST